MINSLQIYEENGRRTGEARNQGDEARAQFHHSWHTRARLLETFDDRMAADEANRRGYREARAPKFPTCNIR